MVPKMFEPLKFYCIRVLLFKLSLLFLYFTATFCCHEEIIKILLSHGADKTITNCDGETAVMLDSSPAVKNILESYTAR